MKTRERKPASRWNTVVLYVLMLALAMSAVLALMPAAANAQTEDLALGAKSSDWMSGLPDDVLLSDLSIPGTHDSGTCWTWDNTIFSVCQDTTIGEHSYDYVNWYFDTETIVYGGMMNTGIRYFDLRLHHEDDGLGLYHGFSLIQCLLMTHDSFWGGTSYDGLFMNNVMRWARDFLAKHPGEALIFQVQNETDSASTDAPIIYDYFRRLAEEDNSIIWAGDHVPTLGEVRGKIVLFMHVDNYDQSDYANDDGTYWAVQMNLERGDSDNKRAAYAFSFNDFDVWSQNQWDGLSPEEKRDYVCNTLARKGRATSFAEDILYENAANGKKTWFISYASANTFPTYTPSGYAEVVNPSIITEVAPADSDVFCGILAVDFSNADMAGHIWRTNYNRLSSWGPASYKWSDDYSTCTATHCKAMDPSVSESVEATIRTEYVEEPSCDYPGILEYIAEFNGCTWAQTQTERVSIPALGHIWESSVDEYLDEPQLTTKTFSRHVWCTRDGCDSGKNRGFVVFLYGPEKTYDGQSAHITWDGKMTEEMKEIITFECIGPSGEKISAGQDFDQAGTYTAHLVLHGQQNVDFEGAFQIGRRPVLVCAGDQVILKGNAIRQGVSYARLSPVEGESASGAVNGHALSEITLTPDGALTEPSDITASGAKITGPEGRDMTANYDLRYQKGQAIVMDVLPDYTPPTAREDLVYDGTEQELVVPGSANGADASQYVFRYALSEAGPYSSSIPKARDADSYTVWWYIKHTQEDANAIRPQSVQVRLVPRTAELKWTNTSFVYNGQFHTPTGEVTNLAEGDSCEVNVERGQMDAGKHRAAVTGLSNKNYARPSGEAMFGHYYIAPRGIMVSGIEAGDKVYDGTTDATLSFDKVTLSGLLEGDKVSVSASGAFDSSFAGERSVNLTDFTLSGWDAGNYVLLPGGQQTAAAAITKRPVTVRALDQRIINTGSFDTDAAVLVQDDAYPLLKDHKLADVRLTTDWPGPEDPSGIFPISVVKDSPRIVCDETDVTANYDITYKVGTLMVVETTPSFTPPQAREGLHYDGTWQELLTPGTIESENFRFQYAIIQPDVWKDEIPVGYRAATYKVFYRIVDKDGVPVGSIAPQEIDVTIAPDNQLGIPDFTLPAALTAIEEEAFAYTTMKIVYVPDTCRSIGAGAFKDCTALVKIRLPKNCAIDDTAFTGCTGFVVYAPAGGTTERWCKANGVLFVPAKA